MSVWMLLIAIIFSDGTTNVHLLNSLKPENNTEESCKNAAEIASHNLRAQFGPNVVIVWGCKKVGVEEFNRALPPPT